MPKGKDTKRKPKRVVLGVGYPWYSRKAPQGHGYTLLELTKTQVPESILFRTGREERVQFKIGETGNYNKVRLIMEILK